MFSEIAIKRLKQEAIKGVDGAGFRPEIYVKMFGKKQEVVDRVFNAMTIHLKEHIAPPPFPTRVEVMKADSSNAQLYIQCLEGKDFKLDDEFKSLIENNSDKTKAFAVMFFTDKHPLGADEHSKLDELQKKYASKQLEIGIVLKDGKVSGNK